MRGKIIMRIPTNPQPTHPGEMLREEFLIPMNLTQKELADSIQVPYQRIEWNRVRQTRRYSEYGFETCQILWNVGGFLAQSAN